MSSDFTSIDANDTNVLGLSRSVICVVGPTASGKTDLAQLIAHELDGHVISADSMQVYRGMDIGTGKISVEERIVDHYGFDLVNPGEPFSAAMFQSFARLLFAKFDESRKRSVLCGGTGFYVRAAIDAYEFPKGEQVGNPVRDKYMLLAEERGAMHVWQLLHEADPESAEIIPPADTKRVVRAFELLAEGESYARQKEKLATIPQCVPAVMIGLQVDPAILANRINARVDKMVASGLIDEVKALLSEGWRDGITAQQAIGYKEIVAALDGDCTMDEAIESIKTATRRYAKRQRTWFRKDKRIHWVDADSGNPESLLEECLSIIANADSQ